MRSCVLLGIEGRLVDVEVDIANGLPSFQIVGLPDKAVRESRERVRAALRNAGYDFPVKRLTVNLSPAWLRKEGDHLDLAIAAAILAASGQLGVGRDRGFWAGCAFIGALSLDGRVQPCGGVLPMALTAREQGLRMLVLPAANAPEAAAVAGLQVIPVGSLDDLAAWVEAGKLPERRGGSAAVAAAIAGAAAAGPGGAPPSPAGPDLAEVRGQSLAVEALEVAAAGGHHLLLVGPPGAGKTLLARCMPGILPPLTPEEALEVARIHSAAGLSPAGGGRGTRPFRSPHHSISTPALIGGGQPPRPGEVTLAHRGVLFLDEVAEFRRDALESLRQILEDGRIHLARSRLSLTLPAQFSLVAAMNPCACGFDGDAGHVCSCGTAVLKNYRSRLSGPFLDRFDLQVPVSRLTYAQLEAAPPGRSSAEVRRRVLAARAIQARRFAGEGISCNAQMAPRNLARYAFLDESCQGILRNAYERLGLSLRGRAKVLKVARTLADLAGVEEIHPEQLARAIHWRYLDRERRAWVSAI